MDESKYDEFGNYIGPKLDSDSDSDENMEEEEDEGEEDEVDGEEDYLSKLQVAIDGSSKTSIVQYEDKEYYKDSTEIYGKGVEVLVETEDIQPIEEPIIKPKKEYNWEMVEKEIPQTKYSKEYLGHFLSNPHLTRNVSLIGNLHSGKTTFVDFLISETHDKFKNNVKSDLKFTDNLRLEKDRGISLKSSPITLLLENSKSKNFCLNLIDTPGHINFMGEVCSSLRVSDGAVIFVDSVEGVMLTTKMLIDKCILESIPMVLFINKFERLILELRLPPSDAYLKLRHTINEVNKIVNDNPLTKSRKFIKMFNPTYGNVVFGSGKHSWCFTLESFAKIYANVYKNFDHRLLMKNLWGEKYFNEDSRKFEKKKQVDDAKRSFVEFVLEPMYKIYSFIVGEEVEDLKETLQIIRVKINKNEMELNVNPLIRLIMKRFFNNPCGFVDAIINHIPSPIDNTVNKFNQFYTGQIPQNFKPCDPNGPLFVYITKFYNNEDCSSFYGFGRIMNGTLCQNDKVKVLGESYSPNDEEDMVIKEVSNIYISNTRYKIGFNKAIAGNLVLIEGISDSVSKTATLTSIQTKCCIFQPLSFNVKSVMKISVEPLNPSELSKMVDGIRKVDQSYPNLVSKVEESGEHVLLGTGELYLDCVMYDLRKVYSQIEIKISDPVVVFRETITETSTIKCNATTPNGENRLTMIAQPMEKGLAEEIEKKNFSFNWNLFQRKQFFEKFDWDLLAAKSLWAFGPSEYGPNVLLNETYPDEVPISELNSIRNFIVQGFKWATKEGPLIEEPIRNVKFKIVHAKISQNILERGSGQIVPTARRVVNSSFLTGNPQIMEPISLVQIQSPLDCVKAIYEVLDRRRGHVIEDLPKPGSPFYVLNAYVPIIDSYGLETDIRTYTQGQAFCLSVFHHWSIVPGDPLDSTIVLQPLEPSPTLYLAREFFVKTRKRKGLSDDINLSIYLDERDRQLLEKI